MLRFNNPTPTSKRIRVARLLQWLVALSMGMGSAAYANLPTGGNFTQGAGSINTTTNAVNVNVTGAVNSVARIDWASFNVGAGNSANFNNGTGAPTVNIVNVDNQGAMSQINGTINGTGSGTNILLVNPNGVSIGAGARIDTTGTFVAAAGTAASAGAGFGSGAGSITVTLNNAPVTVSKSATLIGQGAITLTDNQALSVRAPSTTMASLPAVAGSVDLTVSSDTARLVANQGALIGGTIHLQATGVDAQVTLSDTVVESQNGATVQTTGALRLDQGSRIEALQSGGMVNLLSADTLTMNNVLMNQMNVRARSDISLTQVGVRNGYVIVGRPDTSIRADAFIVSEQGSITADNLEIGFPNQPGASTTMEALLGVVTLNSAQVINDHLTVQAQSFDAPNLYIDRGDLTVQTPGNISVFYNGSLDSNNTVTLTGTQVHARNMSGNALIDIRSGADTLLTFRNALSETNVRVDAGGAVSIQKEDPTSSSDITLGGSFFDVRAQQNIDLAPLSTTAAVSLVSAQGDLWVPKLTITTDQDATFQARTVNIDSIRQFAGDLSVQATADVSILNPFYGDFVDPTRIQNATISGANVSVGNLRVNGLVDIVSTQDAHMLLSTSGVLPMQADTSIRVRAAGSVTIEHSNPGPGNLVSSSGQFLDVSAQGLVRVAPIQMQGAITLVSAQGNVDADGLYQAFATPQGALVNIQALNGTALIGEVDAREDLLVQARDVYIKNGALVATQGSLAFDVANHILADSAQLVSDLDGTQYALSALLVARNSLLLNAGGDISLAGAQITGGAPGTSLRLQAGGNIHAAKTVEAGSGIFTNGIVSSSTSPIYILAAGDVTLGSANWRTLDPSFDALVAAGAAPTYVQATGNLIVHSNVGAAGSTTDSIFMSAGGALTLGADAQLRTEQFGESITLVAGTTFTNARGADALNAPNGRWLVYSQDPALDVRGQAFDFKRYNCSFGGVAGGCANVGAPDIPLTGNGFLYRIAPQLLVVADNQSKVFGQSDPQLTFQVSGLIDGDDASVLDGTLTRTSGESVLGGPYTITQGTLTGANMGYRIVQFTEGQLTITPAFLALNDLVLLGASVFDKQYDGTTNAQINSTGVLSGIQGTDQVALDALSARFVDKNVGNNKDVILVGTLSGADAANYRMLDAIVEANITPKVLELVSVGAQNKTFDGSTRTQVIPGVLTGVIAGDSVGVDQSALQANFSTPDVGSNKPVFITGTPTLVGVDAANYILSTNLMGIVASIGARPETAPSALPLIPSAPGLDPKPVTVRSSSEVNQVVLRGSEILVPLAGAAGSVQQALRPAPITTSEDTRGTPSVDEEGS